MPFVIRPPLNCPAADDTSVMYTIIEPEPYERLILRDLQAWDWHVTRHDFGDEEFADALKKIEKDVKKRRRQTHAIRGELYGYHARPTLEQVWESEAERMLDQGAYNKQQDPRRSAVIEDEEEIRSQVAEKTWLRSIDRTRQTNDHLDYFDPDHDYPRLVTRGLDHTYSCEITATNPKRQSHHHHVLSRMSKSKTFAKHLIHQKPKSFRDILPSLNQLVLEKNQALQNPAFVPFIFDFPTRHFEPTSLPKQQTTTSIPTHATISQHNDNEPPYLHPSQSTPSLIFPHTTLSKRKYVRQTRRGIKRNKSCPPRPRNENEDPYGWLEWDRRRVRSEEGVESAFEMVCVWREGRRLGE